MVAKVALWVVGIFLALALLAIYGHFQGDTRAPSREEVARSEQLQAVAAYEAQLEKAKLSWAYTTREDTMSSKTIKFAEVSSLNELQFDFPYQGSQRATLRLRQHPRFGTDVILSIKRGQFMCSFDDCTVNVRFDEGKPVAFTASEANDSSKDTLFIRNHSKFITAAKKAQRVVIEVSFFREGNRALEFDVQGLKW